MCCSCQIIKDTLPALVKLRDAGKVRMHAATHLPGDRPCMRCAVRAFWPLAWANEQCLCR